ncbi:MAG: FHA domain-containing protein [Gemmataceae bacterium]|nr:FHA domain-containing protein [Gemmataceae bacterium]
MATTIRMTVLTGPHMGRKFCFCGPARCLVGRASDCCIQLAGTTKDQLISRRHCQMLFDPPVLRVQDLGSRNGTFVNGKPVTPVASDGSGDHDAVVHNGDLLTIGGTTVRVDFIDCAPEGRPIGRGAYFWQETDSTRIEIPVRC